MGANFQEFRRRNHRACGKLVGARWAQGATRIEAVIPDLVRTKVSITTENLVTIRDESTTATHGGAAVSRMVGSDVLELDEAEGPVSNVLPRCARESNRRVSIDGRRVEAKPDRWAGISAYCGLGARHFDIECDGACINCGHNRTPLCVPSMRLE